jgi:rubrerythrin
MDAVWFALLVVGVALLGMVVGSGRTRDDMRTRRRWDASFDNEIRRVTRTDATGMLMCRSCGASASERAGRCPSCGAIL